MKIIFTGKFKISNNILFWFLGLSFNSIVETHPGRRAADGCHNEKATGERHCHDSPTQKPKKKIVEKNNN